LIYIFPISVIIIQIIITILLIRDANKKDKKDFGLGEIEDIEEID